MFKNEIKTINVYKGIPASGKTTYALEQMKKYPGKFKRVNRDSLRSMLDGDHFDWDNEDFIVSLRDTIIERSLRKGFDVIVDDTNLKDTNWPMYCDIAKRVGNVRVMEKYFPVELKEALARNALRPKPIPADVIENFFDKYIKGHTVEVRDEFFPLAPPEAPLEDPSKINAIIVDIDGTLSIPLNRSPYDMTKVIEDKPNIPICSLVELLSDSYAVLLVSGREDCARDDTELWMQENNITYCKLFMRETGDNRRDVIIKKEIYEKHIQPYFNVKYVLDDRLQTVIGWRDLNLCCLQVATGDF